MSRQVRDQRGVVAPSRVLLLLVVLVAVAGAAYLLTIPQPAVSARTTAADSAPRPSVTTPTTTPPVTKAPKPAPKKKPAVKRSDVYVEVFNNSGVSGLAGRTSAKAQAVGWKVVGSDNWYGTIPATTVYYPQRLDRAAKILARDLGITRLKPAIAPMRFDRLTVILTDDYTS